MARSQRRRLTLPDFEACSLALFAALAVSAVPQARAQTFGPASVQSSTPATTATTATSRVQGRLPAPRKPASAPEAARKR